MPHIILPRRALRWGCPVATRRAWPYCPAVRRKEIARHLPVMLAALQRVQARHPEVEAVPCPVR